MALNMADLHPGWVRPQSITWQAHHSPRWDTYRNSEVRLFDGKVSPVPVKRTLATFLPLCDALECTYPAKKTAKNAPHDYYRSKYFIQFCKIKGCGGAVWPPPIIFERLKLPQQIIYHQKGTLSESPNHFKYRRNILISRFYDQFSRSSRILGQFWKYEKFQTLKT